MELEGSKKKSSKYEEHSYDLKADGKDDYSLYRDYGTDKQKLLGWSRNHKEMQDLKNHWMNHEDKKREK